MKCKCGGESCVMDSRQTQKESYGEGFIKGMTNLYKKYGGQFKPVEMRKSLERNQPKYFIGEAKFLTGSMASRYEKLFIREYNKKRTTGRIGE